MKSIRVLSITVPGSKLRNTSTGGKRPEFFQPDRIAIMQIRSRICYFLGALCEITCCETFIKVYNSRLNGAE